MGTNYYTPSNKPCDECPDDPSLPCWECHGTGYFLHHIGKSSYGWTFSWHEVEELNLNSAKKWFEYLKDKPIINEYGDKVTYEYFVELVESKEDSELNHTIYCRNNESSERHGHEDCYLDEDGNSFTKTDFS